MFFERKPKSYIEEANSFIGYANQLGISSYNCDRLINNGPIKKCSEEDLEIYESYLNKIKSLTDDQNFIEKIRTIMQFMKDFGNFEIVNNKFKAKFEQEIYNQIEFVESTIIIDDQNIYYKTSGTFDLIKVKGSLEKKETETVIKEFVSCNKRINNEFDNSIIQTLFSEDATHVLDNNGIENSYHRNMYIQTRLVDKQDSSSNTYDDLGKVYYDNKKYSNYRASYNYKRVGDNIIKIEEEEYYDPKYKDDSIRSTHTAKCYDLSNKRIPIKLKYKEVNTEKLQDNKETTKTR